MNVFDGQSTVSPRTPANSSAASAAPVQLARRDRRQPVPAVPGRLERLDQRALRPALRRRGLIPELVQTRAIALIEADREGAELGAFGGRHHQRHQRGDGAIAAAAPTLSTASSTGRLRASAARLRAHGPGRKRLIDEDHSRASLQIRL